MLWFCKLAFFGTSTVSLSLSVLEEKLQKLLGGVPARTRGHTAVHTCGQGSEPQRLLHDLLGDLVKLFPVIPPHFGGIHVGPAFIVGL